MSHKVRMTLLVDEKSHPDLYADLIGIEGDRNRTERVRYLAGLGLHLGTVKAHSRPSAGHTSTGQTVVGIADSGLSVTKPQATQATRRRKKTEEASTTPTQGSEVANSVAQQALGGLPVASEAAGSVAPSQPASASTNPETEVTESPASRAARLLASRGVFGVPGAGKGST